MALRLNAVISTRFWNERGTDVFRILLTVSLSINGFISNIIYRLYAGCLRYKTMKDPHITYLLVKVAIAAPFTPIGSNPR